MSQQVPTDFFTVRGGSTRALGSIHNLLNQVVHVEDFHSGRSLWEVTVHIQYLNTCCVWIFLWCVEYLPVCWKVKLYSYCSNMLRCVLQRATHLKNVEKGERQSDPLASITFRGKTCRMNLGGKSYEYFNLWEGKHGVMEGSIAMSMSGEEFSLWLRVFSGFSGLLPPPKKYPAKWISSTKWPLGVNECVHGAL